MRGSIAGVYPGSARCKCSTRAVPHCRCNTRVVPIANAMPCVTNCRCGTRRWVQYVGEFRAGGSAWNAASVPGSLLAPSRIECRRSGSWMIDGAAPLQTEHCTQWESRRYRYAKWRALPSWLRLLCTWLLCTGGGERGDASGRSRGDEHRRGARGGGDLCSNRGVSCLR
jgi:hypothetical protein